MSDDSTSENVVSSTTVTPPPVPPQASRESDENTNPNIISSTEENRVISGASRTKLKVTLKGWNGVGVWKWVANDDTCGICRVAFDGCCPDCKLPGDDCPLVWGTCTHCFHIHCIMKWLNSQQAQHLCPMCRQDWKFKGSVHTWNKVGLIYLGCKKKHIFLIHFGEMFINYRGISEFTLTEILKM